MTDYNVSDWAYAYGGPSGQGQIKTQTDDFVVEELLSFTPEGSGEHVFLYLEKSGENTEYVARLLARHAGVRQRDIGFAGLKDRHGRTRQWFSIWLPGKDDPDWRQLQTDKLKILQIVRHTRKLKRGALSGNRFDILIRNLQADTDQIEQQLNQIKIGGFPNYFGEQRFGHQGRNLNAALAMFQGVKVKREQQSIYLSAVRSYLFNLILSERVSQHTWNQAMSGDVFNLNHTHSSFVPEHYDQILDERLAVADIHPTGVLWGKGDSRVSADAAAIEQQVIAGHEDFADGLIKAGLEVDRRALRAMPESLSWQFTAENCLRLSFVLPAGSYATVLLREIVKTT
jgi:tRNA pseudouridine13 synthase